MQTNLKAKENKNLRTNYSNNNSSIANTNKLTDKTNENSKDVLKKEKGKM